MTKRRQVDTGWFKARLRDLRKTQEGLAAHIGIDAPGTSNMLHGKRGMSIDEAALTADYLECDMYKVLKHAGIVLRLLPPPTIPVVGDASTGDLIVPRQDTEAAAIERIEAPPGYEDGSAVIVRGDSFSPRFLNGEALAYRNKPQDPEELLGKEVIVQLRDGRLVLKRLALGSAPGRYSLLSINPTAPVMVDAPIDWVAKVDWHKTL